MATAGATTASGWETSAPQRRTASEHLRLHQQLAVLSRPTRKRPRLRTRDKLCWILVHLAVTAHPTAAWVWRHFIAATPWGCVAAEWASGTGGDRL